jgi:ATP-dependent Lhr-like helicase
LFWEVFKKYDPHNRLLQQAEAELLAHELDISRLQQTLQRMAAQTLVLKPLARATPLGFPLMVERLREKLSTESVADRIARMLAPLEKAAGDGGEPSRTALPSGDDLGSAVRQTLAFGQDQSAAANPKRQRSRRRS